MPKIWIVFDHTYNFGGYTESTPFKQLYKVFAYFRAEASMKHNNSCSREHCNASGPAESGAPGKYPELLPRKNPEPRGRREATFLGTEMRCFSMLLEYDEHGGVTFRLNGSATWCRVYPMDHPEAPEATE